MKLAHIILIFSFGMAGCYSTGQVPSNEYGSENYNSNYNHNVANVSYQTFYDELQPYGNWINYPGYGYVWQPNAGAGFRPYETDGHWVSTVDGWAWASDRSWGWAPFHYGRWLNDPSIGWAWVPGYEWAPAWVTWGRYDNYYAWAPLAPGINISIGNVWRAPSSYWSYIPYNCIQQRNLDHYIVRNNRSNIVVNNITIIDNYNTYNRSDYYHRGPDYQEVERNTHTVIRPVAIASTTRPGIARVDNSNHFEIYRPAIAQTNITAASNARPARFTNMNDAVTGSGTQRPPAQNNAGGKNGSAPLRIQDNKTYIADDAEPREQPTGGAFREGNLNTRNTIENINRNGASRQDDGFSAGGNDNPVNQRPSVNNQPAMPDNVNTPQQQSFYNEDARQRRQMKREQQQQAQLNNGQPNQNQPVFQNNNRAGAVNNSFQQNDQMIRQQQQRQMNPQPNMQVERPKAVNSQPQNMVRPNRAGRRQ